MVPLKEARARKLSALGTLLLAPMPTTLRVPGGHVGAVVGSRASRELYPALARWLDARLASA